MHDPVVPIDVEHDCPLTARSVSRWASAAVRLIGRAQPVINGANIFPVADSDTGTNLLLTLTHGADALALLPEEATWEDALRAFARGALTGARGNSGIILSEYLRGFARGAVRPPDHGAADDARVVAVALDRAATSAYNAVGHPRQGTILTAARGAATGAAHAEGLVSAVMADARAGAYSALMRSVDELDVLAAAGVLDAGAYGLVLVLDSLGAALGKAPGKVSAGSVSQADGMIAIMTSLAVNQGARGPGVDGSAPHVRTDTTSVGNVDGEFEVMGVIEHTGSVAEVEAMAPMLRRCLGDVGESVVVVGGAEPHGTSTTAGTTVGIWHVHVHTDNPVEALRVIEGWTHRQIVVRCLPCQVVTRAAGEKVGHGVVACTAAPGLVADVARTGAVVVVEGSVPIEVVDIERAAMETHARAVSILPASSHTLNMLGRDARPLTGNTPILTVVPSTSDLHVVAAVSAWAVAALDDPDRADIVLRDAVEAVNVVTIVGTGSHDPVLAISDLASVAPGTDILVTILADDAVPAATLAGVLAHVESHAPEAEVVLLSSGRRSTGLLLGVERT